MADPDWLSELSEALEADAERSASPGDEPELELSGSGRPLEGWADQLADAMDEDVGLEGRPAADTAIPTDPGHPADTWADELTEAMGEDLPLDRQGSEQPQPVPGWPDVAPPPTPPPPAADLATIERLARIENLLGADLDKLGTAVLAESVAAIETRVEIALERLASLDAPLATLEQRLAAHAATLSEPVRVQALVPPELGELLGDLSMRFASLEALIAEVTVEPMPDELLTGPPAVDLEPLLVTLAAMHTRIEELATQRVAPAEAGEQLGVDLEPLTWAVGQQRNDLAGLLAVVGQLQDQVAELASRPAPVSTEPAAALDLDPMVQAFGAHREYLAALRDVIAGLQGQVAELAARPAPEAVPAVDLEPLVSAFGEQRDDVAALTGAVESQRAELAVLAAAVSGVHELRTQMAEVASRPAAEVPGMDLDPLVSAVGEQGREVAALAAAVSGLADLRSSVVELHAQLSESAAETVPDAPAVDLEPVLAAVEAQRGEVAALAATMAGVRSPEPTDPELVEALKRIYDTLVEQGGDTIGTDQLQELAESMARHQDGLVDRIDQAAATWSPQVSVPPESLLPVAKVIGDRIEEGRKADRATLEVLTSRVAAMEAAVAAAGKDDETGARLAKSISTLGSRLTSVEKRLADSGEIDEMIRQALGDLVIELATVRRTLMG